MNNCTQKKKKEKTLSRMWCCFQPLVSKLFCAALHRPVSESFSKNFFFYAGDGWSLPQNSRAMHQLSGSFHNKTKAFEMKMTHLNELRFFSTSEFLNVNQKKNGLTLHCKQASERHLNWISVCCDDTQVVELISACSPPRFPAIAWTPSVQIPTQSSHFRSASVK